MERTIIESGAIFKWHNSKEELPKLKDKKDNIACVTFMNGKFHINVWNEYYQCWDDAEGDDYEFSKEYELLWCPLKTMSADEFIKL